MNCFVEVFDTPTGEMFVAVDEDGAVLRLDFLKDRGPDDCVAQLEEQGLEAVADAERTQPVREQLSEYFAGRRRSFDLALAPVGTEWQRQVWSELEKIPYGRTLSYGELAARLGRPGSSRAVGSANGANPIAIVVPCHRVIGADGSLTGYASGVDLKEKLLRLEGALAETLF